MSQSMYRSEIELAKFLGSIDIIPYAFRSIRELSDNNLPYELHTSPHGIKVLAFNCRPDYTSSFVNGDSDLVSSQNHKVVDFISTKVNPSFRIKKAAVELFEHFKDDMKELEKKDLKSPLVVTGWGVGGYLAILSALWLQRRTIYKEESKHPICLTFGCPLIGDEALRKAIHERPQWKSCFLNLVSMKDYVASFVPSAAYKPFGTFLFCTESGRHATFKEPQLILAVLHTIALPRDEIREEHDYADELSSIKRKNVLYRGVLVPGECNLTPLTEGIKEIGVLDKISNELISEMELEKERIIRNKKNTYEPVVKLNDIKILMAYVEWYIKTGQSGEGYYDCYRKQQPIRNKSVGHNSITKQCETLNIYWEKFVREKEESPQVEGGKLLKRWLYSGNNYRRMIEPLVIAKHYKEGKTNYMETRSDHFKLLEFWLKEYEKTKDQNADINTAPNINHDSCFWAYVEEALILLGRWRNEAKLEKFMEYVMQSINRRLVSPDIFLKGSSFMKWWSEYADYKQVSSELAQYMSSGRYKSYQ